MALHVLASRTSAPTHSIGRSALIVAFGTLASRLLGLVRDALTARYFPPETRDAFVIAFRLPNLFRRVLTEGAFSASFVPAVTRDPASAQRLASALFAAVMAGALTASILGVAFMAPLLGCLLSGAPFVSVPGKLELTVTLARIMFGFLGLAALYAYFMAALHAVGRFALAALAPVLFNGSMIAAAFLFPSDPPTSARTLAWSVIVGGFLQAAALAPAVRQTAFWPRLRGMTWPPEAGRALRASVATALGSSLLQATGFANLWFASRLPQGSHSYLYLADRILELPLSLFAISVGSAILPQLARLWATGDREAVGATMSSALRLALFPGALNAAGMIALATPIVDVLFVGHEFTFADGAQTALLIQIYAGVLVAAGGARILAQGFYAAGREWFPALAGGVALASHLFLAAALSNAFGLPGLAWATLASQLILAALLAAAFRSRIAPLGRPAAVGGLLASATLAGLAAQSYWPLSARLPHWIALLAAIALAVVVYAATAFALGAPECKQALLKLRARGL